ncbi:hypothetical protein ABT263_20530 [Kitasatospora sp. NPDC001603]|uniref:hypothetical protein n=1 Tax=Kitasatospora sp. NPDC001603 TaxID=3154388 RepID=UPI003321F2AA
MAPSSRPAGGHVPGHLTWDVARATVNTIEARLHLVEARTQGGRDTTDLDVGSPNPLFSHAA